MAECQMEKAEIFSFHPDIDEMLSFIVNASSSNNEIFLRDLLSYSFDALDEIRYESSADKSKLDGLSIQLVPDKANKRKTLSIIDSGVGMTKSDLVSNLGTIATTNIREFLEELQAGADVNKIGQFGVGLYSTYLVAKKVVVTTKHDGEKQFIWESEARGSFTITEDTFGEQIGRGTKITLYLRDDQLDYLEQRKLKDLVKKHSKFISYPIYL